MSYSLVSICSFAWHRKFLLRRSLFLGMLIPSCCASFVTILISTADIAVGDSYEAVEMKFCYVPFVRVTFNPFC